ncbi:MAG TPA: AraC family transcriptional regulator [Stellaceae bacterium]|nr:AraC family transcriptional regulator [Stellaceae bacterium]
MDHRAANRIAAFDALLGSNGGTGPDYVVSGAGGRPIAAKWHRPASRNRLSNLREHVLMYHVGGSTSVSMFVKGKCLGTGSQHGSVTLYPYDCESDFVRGGTCEVLHLYLDPDLVTRYAEENLPGAIDVRLDPLLAVKDPWLQGYFAMLISEFELYGGIGGQAHSLLLAQTRQMVIRHLVHWHSSAMQHSRRAAINARAPHPLSPRRLKAVVEYIEANLTAAIDLADLAALTGLSANHFIRSFHAATQRTPYAYVVHRRLSLVAAALRSSEAPLSEIARASGFRSLSTLTNTFKRHHGVTPSRYRALAPRGLDRRAP